MAKITVKKNVLFTVTFNNGKIASVRYNLNGRFIKVQTYLKLAFSEFGLFDKFKNNLVCALDKAYKDTFKTCLDSRDKNNGVPCEKLFAKSYRLAKQKRLVNEINQYDLAIA